MRLRYKPATWGRLLARLGLCLAAFALLCALTGLSPTRRLALLRGRASAHFYPAQVLCDFSDPKLDCYHSGECYYVTRREGWICLSPLERTGPLWREVHPIPVPIDRPLTAFLVDYAGHLECRYQSPRSIELLERGSRALWLLYTPDPAVARVTATEVRRNADLPNPPAEPLPCEAAEAAPGSGVWLINTARPTDVGGFGLYDLELVDVCAYGADGALLYTLDRVGGVSVIPSDTIPPT